MADVDMGSTETTATAMALIASMVQKQLIASAQIMFTIQDETARAVDGLKSVSFPKAGNLTPVAKVENTATESQVLTYAVDTLALDQHTHTFVRLEDNQTFIVPTSAAPARQIKSSDSSAPLKATVRPGRRS